MFPVLPLMSCLTLGRTLALFVPHSSGRNELAPFSAPLPLPDYFLVGKPRYTHENRINAHWCDMSNKCNRRRGG